MRLTNLTPPGCLLESSTQYNAGADLVAAHGSILRGLTIPNTRLDWQLGTLLGGALSQGLPSDFRKEPPAGIL